MFFANKMRWTATSLVALSATLTSALPTESLKRQEFNYTQAVLYHHNIHRANHSAFNLFWDEGLASSALTVAQTCVWAHKMDVDGGNYGQNLAGGLADTEIGTSISDLWYNGEAASFSSYYNVAQPSYDDFEKWGHFTQVLWKSTTKVGCASYYCEGGLSGVGSNVVPWFTVCNYGGPGNWAGLYAENVGLPLGLPTVNGSSPLVDNFFGRPLWA